MTDTMIVLFSMTQRKLYAMHQTLREHAAFTAGHEQTADTGPRQAAGSDFPPSLNWRPQPRRTVRWRLLAACAGALLVLWTTLLLTGGLTIGSIQRALPVRTFLLHGHGTLVVNQASGSVHIHPGGPDRVVVRGNVFIAGFLESENTPQVQYAQNGNTVIVTSSASLMLLGTRELTLDITVPAVIDLTVHNSSADALIEGVTGSIAASTSSGNLNLNDTDGPLHLNASSGNISMRDQQGSVSAQTASGNIGATGLIGSVDLSTTSGNITLAQAQIHGEDHLRTSSGDISVSGTLDPHGSYHLATSSGNVTLALPANASFQLRTSSNSGALRNDFAADVVGNSPRAYIEVQTHSGDISVQRQ